MPINAPEVEKEAFSKLCKKMQKRIRKGKFRQLADMLQIHYLGFVKLTLKQRVNRSVGTLPIT